MSEMPDWYRTHNASPDAYPDSEYTDWAQDNGLYVDAAGNVDYGPPVPDGDVMPFDSCAEWRED
jgi:hypothetical protein